MLLERWAPIHVLGDGGLLVDSRQWVGRGNLFLFFLVLQEGCVLDSNVLCVVFVLRRFCTDGTRGIEIARFDEFLRIMMDRVELGETICCGALDFGILCTYITVQSIFL